MMPHLEAHGVKGVTDFLRNIGNELRFIMSSTGFKNVADIDSSALRIH